MFSSALECRDNGRGNRAHSIEDLNHEDYARLYDVLASELHDSCSHCKHWGCPHGEKCIQYKIRYLPPNLQSHANIVSRAILQSAPSDYRARVNELCPVHVRLRPELLWSMLKVFVDAESTAASLMSQLAAIPGFLADKENIDKLAPLAVVAKASRMWSLRDGKSDWKDHYPECRREAQWRTQRDICAACILARTLESPKLVSMILLLHWLVNGRTETASASSDPQKLAWIDHCLYHMPRASKLRSYHKVEALYSWITEQLAKTGTGKFRKSTRIDRTALGMLLRKVQDMEKPDSTPATPRSLGPADAQYTPGQALRSISLSRTQSVRTATPRPIATPTRDFAPVAPLPQRAQSLRIDTVSSTAARYRGLAAALNEIHINISVGSQPSSPAGSPVSFGDCSLPESPTPLVSPSVYSPSDNVKIPNIMTHGNCLPSTSTKSVEAQRQPPVNAKVDRRYCIPLEFLNGHAYPSSQALGRMDDNAGEGLSSSDSGTVVASAASNSTVASLVISKHTANLSAASPRNAASWAASECINIPSFLSKNTIANSATSHDTELVRNTIFLDDTDLNGMFQHRKRGSMRDLTSKISVSPVSRAETPPQPALRQRDPVNRPTQDHVAPLTPTALNIHNARLGEPPVSPRAWMDVEPRSSTVSSLAASRSPSHRVSQRTGSATVRLAQSERRARASARELPRSEAAHRLSLYTTSNIDVIDQQIDGYLNKLQAEASKSESLARRVVEQQNETHPVRSRPESTHAPLRRQIKNFRQQLRDSSSTHPDVG